jgi:hypothetical protein
MFIAFGAGAYDQNDHELPPVVLENLRSQVAPDNAARQLRLVPTPGLTEFATGFTGTAGGIFQSDGVLSGAIITATGTQVSSVNSSGTRSTISGAIASGTYSPKFAASQAPELVVVAGGNTYSVAGSVSSFTWSGPTGDIIDVDVAGQLHLYVEDGSGRLWISDSGDAETVTRFITAEQDPDGLRGVANISGDIFLMGSKVTEVAYLTGDTTVPLAFRPNFVIDYGLKSSRAYTKVDGRLFFVGHDSQVYDMAGGRPVKIGTQPIANLIGDLSTAQLAGLEMRSYSQVGEKFAILTIPGYGDMFYDIELNVWHRRRRLTSTESGVGPVVQAFGGIYCLDNKPSGNATLLEIDRGTYTNNGEYVRRVATALVPIEDEEIRIDQVRIMGQTGVALDGNGQGSDPQLMFRIALDGRSFGNEITRSMGKIGQYRHSIIYGPLGIARPGVIAVEVAYSDPVSFSLTGAVANPKVLR